MFEALLSVIEPLHKLNKGKGLYRDEYPVFNSDLSVNERWDNLTYCEMIDVGALTLHFRYMSPNYKWLRIDQTEKFSELRKPMRKIIEKCYKRRNEKYSMFDLKALFHLQ